MFWHLLLFIVSCVVLVKSGGVVVKHLVNIAMFLRWGEFVVAFLLMAVVTSLPELFVGITSALHKKPELAFGNIIGANIINLTLVTAIPVLIAGVLELKSLMAQRTAVYTSIIAVLPIFLMVDGKLSRIDGFILLLCLAFYFQWVLNKREKFKKVFNGKRFGKSSTTTEATLAAAVMVKTFLKDLAWFFTGIILLLLAAEGLVRSASVLASGIGVPLFVVSVLFVSLGTTLPELIFSIKAVSLKHKDMVLANLMGSVIVNSTLVLGVTVLIYPLRVFDFSPYIAGILFTLATILFFALFARSHKRIDRKEGLFLLLIYFVFIVVQLFLG